MPTVAVPTSDILSDLLDEAPRDAVALGWIFERLDERSFGLVILLLALLAMVPGVSPIAGALIIWIAGQMILARRARPCRASSPAKPSRPRGSRV